MHIMLSQLHMVKPGGRASGREEVHPHVVIISMEWEETSAAAAATAARRKPEHKEDTPSVMSVYMLLPPLLLPLPILLMLLPLLVVMFPLPFLLLLLRLLLLVRLMVQPLT